MGVWAAVAAAVISAGAGAAAASKSRSAAKRAAASQQSALTNAGIDASALYGPYADFGLGALKKLGRLTGNKDYLGRYGATPEAEELKNLKARMSLTPQQMLDELGVRGKAAVQTALAQFEVEKSKAEKRIPELEQIVAQQTAEQQAAGPETMGADYLRELPGYQFRLGEGQRALDNTQSRRNMALSGAALREIGQYNQDFASTEYQNEFSRLYQMAGLGANAVTGQANAALGVGTGLSNIYGQQGADQANYYQSVNNAVQGGIGNAAYLYGKNQRPANQNQLTSYGGNTYSSPGTADYFSGQDSAFTG